MSNQVYGATIVLIILWAIGFCAIGVYAIGFVLIAIAMICILLVFMPIKVNLRY
ncbi:MAG: hypothetical protein IPH20_25820 [Bacteroidales bacterium]|nr:hypothetical protein [Bacteroidales bacterium]MBK6967219.1 hypothetical protein [Bacteroidales bacterium]